MAAVKVRASARNQTEYREFSGFHGGTYTKEPNCEFADARNDVLLKKELAYG